MKGKTIAFIPVLLAGIVMMLSFSIPHHHHNELICFTVSHCEDSESGDECRHEHDASQPGESPCSVQALQLADISRNHHTAQNSSTPPLPDFMPVLADIAQGANDTIILTGTGTQVFPTFYHERLHASDWSVTLAGRAPPMIIV